MELTHIDENGKAMMVDISGKDITFREAAAEGRVYMKQETLDRVTLSKMPKGDVFSTARIAGIMAAKRTQELIPMCHSIPLNSIDIELVPDKEKNCVHIKSNVKCTWRTGVEMEALTAVTVAALTVYDMCKAIDKEMLIGDIGLLSKTGGKSGDYFKGRKDNV